VRLVLRRTLGWGGWFGGALGAVIAALSGVIGLAFTGDAHLAALIQPALVLMAVAQPLAGVVYVLDGVLMGAGDARYLALAGGLNLVPFLPALGLVAWAAPSGAGGLTWLTACFFGVYMGARAVTLGARVRGGAWMGADEGARA